jgi:hypothetical protein
MKTFVFALLFGCLLALTGPAPFLAGSPGTAQAQQCPNGVCPPQ